MVILASETMSPKLSGVKVAFLQNSVGQRLRRPKLRGSKIEGKSTRKILDPSTFAPRSFGPVILCPAEFCSNATFAAHSL